MTLNLGTAQIIQGNALALPLPDSSVDLVCTSPPYFGLRSYQDGCRTCASSPDSYRVKTCSGCGETTSRVKCHNGCDAPMKWTKPEPLPTAECSDCGGTGKGHYDGQIGSEATPAEFLEVLLAATREMMRVLKPTGSIFVNLGDKYSGGRSGPQGETGQRSDRRQAATYAINVRDIQTDIPSKSLMGLPWRYAIRCIDDLGLILRAEIIWAKPNGLPESVTDRVRRSHEQWFHFTKQPRYFSAVDEIRETYAPSSFAPNKVGNNAMRGRAQMPDRMDETGYTPGWEPSPLGKLPGSVWTIPTQPLTVPPELGVDHFAAYPMEWPRRIIQGWTPNGVCTACGEGRRPARGYEEDTDGYFGPTIEVRKSEPTCETAAAIAVHIRTARQAAGYTTTDVSERVTGRRTGACSNWENGLNLPIPEYWRKLKVVISLGDEWDHIMLDTVRRPSAKGNWVHAGIERHRTASGIQSQRSPEKNITGYVCGCPTPNAPTTPAVCLDPFGGTGTTALVAKALGRTGITIDLSADYCRLAEWRCNDPRELAAALQVEKPEPVHPDQLDLFGEYEEPKTRGNKGSSLIGIQRVTCETCGYRSQNARATACEKCGAMR